MKFEVMQISTMGSNLGDIFWDLAPYIVYSPGYDIGCNIYVANPTDTSKEYALMATLYRNSTKLSEEALPVFGLTWFTVDPGDFVTLKGAMRFSDSDAVLTVSLIEKESGQAIDSVTTGLIAPTGNSALPPAWPGTTTQTTTTSWTSMLGTMMPMLMFMMLGMVMASSFKSDKETKLLTAETRR